MMDSVADTSPRRLARIAGALYLINVVAGAFAIGFVRSTLVAPGDPAATAYTIQTHVVVTVTNVPLAVIFYDCSRWSTEGSRCWTRASSW